jgi:hypothetical protein
VHAAAVGVVAAVGVAVGVAGAGAGDYVMLSAAVHDSWEGILNRCNHNYNTFQFTEGT